MTFPDVPADPTAPMTINPEPVPLDVRLDAAIDVLRLLEEETIPARTEYVVRTALPHGGTTEHYFDTDHEAKVLAFALTRDYAAAGITGAHVVAARRLWVCIEEETILDTGGPE